MKEDETNMKNSIGIIEVDGLCAAFEAMDIAAKVANIQIKSVERTRENCNVCVRIVGDVSSVELAVATAVNKVKKMEKHVISLVIPAPMDEIHNVFSYSNIKSKESEESDKEAIGIVEVIGLTNGVYALDQMLKTAGVEFAAKEVIFGAGRVGFFVKGKVSDVEMAINALKGNVPFKLYATSVIGKPEKETMKFVHFLK